MKVRYIFAAILIAGCTESREIKLQRFLLKGNVALSEKNTEQATNYFQEALKIDPCFVEASNNLGTISFRAENMDAALAHYNTAIACKPDFLPALFNRANVFYEMRQYFSAIDDVNAIILLKPDTAAVYFLKGLIATRMHDYPLALSAFDKALERDSTNVEYLVNHGTINYYLKRFDEARRDLANAEKRNALEPNIYNTLALVEISNDNKELALEHVQKAIAMSPDDPYFINNRGYILLLMNRLTEAVTDIDGSILMDPKNGWAYRNKGIYYLLSGDYVNALRMLKQGYDMDPFIDKIHFYLGLAYLRSGQRKEACVEFGKSDRIGDKMTTPEILKACR